MLFYIDESMIENVTKENDYIIECLENLARARRLGKHLIVASRKTLDFLRKNELINSRERMVYRALFYRYSQLKSLFDLVSHIVYIVPEKGVMQTDNSPDGKKILKISADIFIDYSVLTETSLLVEDLNDAHIYKMIGEYYCRVKNYAGVLIKYNFLQGGGDRTSIVFEDNINSRKSFVLCICDTDKKGPNHRKGTTLTKLIRTDSQNHSCLCELYYGHYHEIENLIPVKLYKEFLSSECPEENNQFIACATENMNLLSFIKLIVEKDLINCLLYFDYKEGIKIKEFNDCNFRNYWEDILIKVSALNEYNIIMIDKLEKLSKEEKKSKLVCGNENNILLKVYKYFISKYTLEDIDKYFMEDYLREEWLNIGKLVASWCCGASPMVQTA